MANPYYGPEYFNKLVKMAWDYVGEVAKLYLGEDAPSPGEGLLGERLPRKRDAQRKWYAAPGEEREALLAQVGIGGLLGEGGLFESLPGGKGEAKENGNA